MTGERVFEALTDCADELEGEIVARYVHADGVHPAMQHKYDRDMQTVIDARTAITTLRAQVAALAGEKAADKARLDWMEAQFADHNRDCNLMFNRFQYDQELSLDAEGASWSRMTIRSSLDAARGGEG